jgi:hypothetical protein
MIGIVKRFDPVEGAQQTLNAFALHTDPSSVDQPDLTQTAPPRLHQILERDVFDIGGTKRMEVEDILDRQSVPDGVTVTNNSTGKVSYNPTGFANNTAGQTPMSRVVICDTRGNAALTANSAARGLIIAPTGRARTTKDVTEIGNALGVIGGSCP